MSPVRSRSPAPSIQPVKFELSQQSKLTGDSMQNITPFLWFDGKAEEAMNFYLSSFKNSKVGRVTRYGEAGPGPKGSVMSATFQLELQEFMALNGGPQFGSRQLYRSS